MKRALLLVTLLCSLPSIAGAQDYYRGRSAYERGDHATAIRWFRALAEQGMVEAQFHLGTMYDRGEGGPQDYTDAVKWYRKAAEEGHGRAARPHARHPGESPGQALRAVGSRFWPVAPRGPPPMKPA